MAAGIAPIAFLLMLLAGGAIVTAGTLLIGAGDTLGDVNGTLLNGSINGTTPEQFANFTVETVADIPFQDLADYLYAGTTGLFNWVGAKLASLVQLVMRIFVPTIVVPLYFGWVLTLLIMLWFFWSRWQAIWDFVLKHFIFVLIILVIVFFVGLTLQYMGLI